MQALVIAIRNITRQKKRTALLGSAIAFGVLVIVLLGSFTQGVLINARENLSGAFGGHVFIGGEELSASGRVMARIGDRAELEAALATVGDEIAATRLRSKGRGELIFASRQESVVVEGVQWEKELTLLGDLGVAAESGVDLSASDALVLPEKTAETLGAVPGEKLLFRVSTILGQANVGEFTLAAVYPDQGGVGSTSAYTSLAYLNGFLGLASDDYQNLSLVARDIRNMDAVAARLVSQLTLQGEELAPKEEEGLGALRSLMSGMGSSLPVGGDSWKGTRFSISTLNEVMAPLLSIVTALTLIRIGLSATLLAIIMVGLLNSFRMVLIERTQEIGAMRAIGMQRSFVRNIFLLEALFLALAGAAAGLLVALLCMGVFGNIRFDASSGLRMFSDNGVFSFPLVTTDLLSTILWIEGGSLLAAWLPARKASRMRPAEALRTSY